MDKVKNAYWTFQHNFADIVMVFCVSLLVWSFV